MNPTSLARTVLSICIVLIISSAPAAVFSKGGPALDKSLGADGDGYPDLAIGIPCRDYGPSLCAGMVGVAYGLIDGLDYVNGQTFDLSTPGMIGDPGMNNYYGQALADGDFNGDGYVDLAVGVPGKAYTPATNTGIVSILYGSSSGYSGSSSQYMDQAQFGINTPETGDRFGAALAAGDFNGDGYDDLAVGVPGQDLVSIESAGIVDVVYGQSGGIPADGFDSDEWVAVLQGLWIEEAPEAGDYFGEVLASGDFDGDGYDDLVIGVPGEDLTVGVTSYTDAGVVQVVYGSAAGLSFDGDELFYQGHEGLQDGPENDDRFGAALAVGNFNGGSYDDLAIGAPREDFSASEAGFVHVLWADWSGLTPDNDLVLSQGLIAGQSYETNDHFGWSLATGDFNNDEKDDLAIGAPGQDVSGRDQAGSVHVFNGSAFTAVFTQDNPLPMSADQFGWALAAADFDQNGYADLVVSIPYYDRSIEAPNSGVVVTMYSDADGIDGSYFELGEIDLFGDGSLPPLDGDVFGFSLVVLDAPHWDYDLLYLPVVRK